MWHSKWATGSFAVLTCVSVVINLSNSCCADAMNSWQGASASVDAGGKQATDSGATASANTAGSYTASYLGSMGGPYTIGISGSGSASASGNPDNLLTAGAYLTMGDPGLMSSPLSPTYPISATASWNNDSLIVHAPPGASLPNSVQLQFKVDLLPDNASYGPGTDMNSAVIKINGKSITVDSNGTTDLKFQPAYTGWSYPDQHHTATFDINLALHPDGVSDPFSLSLSTARFIYTPPFLGGSVWSSGDTIAVSLTGVTLPDGTPLSAAGYSASFASGMALPEQPVPEPATFVVWGLLAVGAFTFRHRVLTNRPGH